ncbi:hypothetical protein [Chryseobacterium sp. MMS23-Vi53]|uniref:hypothetical protein n=1 Tax=Chryseobacterium sp. MMS23-Vi53 TaxID=3386644 RepID=UPI0039EC13DC
MNFKAEIKNFITDSSGNNLFIGVGQLPFQNERPITRFNFIIITDKKGNFTGVREEKQLIV